jgi:hypothetical protein
MHTPYTQLGVVSGKHPDTHTHTQHTQCLFSFGCRSNIVHPLYILLVHIRSIFCYIFGSSLPVYPSNTHTQKNNANEKKQNKKNPKNMARGMAGSIGHTEWSPHFQPHPSTTQCCCKYILSYRIHLSIRERARPLMGRLDMYRVAANFSIRSRRRRMKWTLYLFWASPGLIFGCSKKWDEGRNWWEKINK